MASFRGISVVLMSIVVVILMVKSTAEPDISLSAGACDGRQIIPTSDYARARGKALDDAVAKTPVKDFDYHGRESYNSDETFTHGKCYGYDSKEDCWRCMQMAMMYVLRTCMTNTEGWVQLQDCYVGFFEFQVY